MVCTRYVPKYILFYMLSVVYLLTYMLISKLMCSLPVRGVRPKRHAQGTVGYDTSRSISIGPSLNLWCCVIPVLKHYWVSYHPNGDMDSHPSQYPFVWIRDPKRVTTTDLNILEGQNTQGKPQNRQENKYWRLALREWPPRVERQGIAIPLSAGRHKSFP